MMLLVRVTGKTVQTINQLIDNGVTEPLCIPFRGKEGNENTLMWILLRKRAI